MTSGRILRLILTVVLSWPFHAGAVSRVDIHIGEVRHLDGVVENLEATLDMAGNWHGRAMLREADLPALARQRKLPLAINQGRVQGRAEFSGRDTVLQQLRANLELSDVAFTDAEGLHAGEQVGGRVELEVQRDGGRWRWSGQLDWRQGEAYWHPLYLANGVRLQAGGMLDDAALTLSGATLNLAGVGTANFSARLARPDNRLSVLDLAAQLSDAAGAYAVLLKPYLDKTLLGDLDVGGRADVSVQLRDGTVTGFEVALHELDVEDKGGRFALYKVSARVPWALNKPTQVALHYDGGRLLKLPLGETDLAATLNGYSLTAPVLRVPLLDGALTLQDVSAAFLQKKWHWHLGASLSPLSMEEFSHAVGWPTMQGKVAASIPMVTYSNGRLTTEGEMGLNVFDGSIVVRKLVLQDPLGLAPRLAADVQMRDLDLELLTKTFAFGAMTGRLDVDVNNLQLSRWQPVHFDASVRSSPGKYPKKISQRAVENISALGGAGAAAAIQRSFLRFFKEFNYAQIGLSCRLRNGVCQMDGVKPTDGGYVIVEGSGVPAITVLGYNRSVSWGELLTRLKRITQGGAAPVIK